MGHQRHSEIDQETPDSNHPRLKLFAGTILALCAWGLVANFKDIKRYFRISTM